jgi:hypothetical protein
MKTTFAIIIYFSFILFTVIGTLSHEFGHFIVGRFLGYKSVIHYGYTSWGENPILESKMNAIYLRNKDEIQSKKDYDEKPTMFKLFKIDAGNRFWMTVGGPFTNILIGSIGFMLIIWLRKRHNFATTNFHWFCLFLTFFWMRQPNNLVAWLVKIPMNGSNILRGDEINLARHLNLPSGTIIWITGILGLLICGYAILKFVPKDKLRTFLISGFLGGISGIILWLKILGPIILP